MERLIASANENINIESEQIRYVHMIYVYTLAEDSRMGRMMPACLDTVLRAMKNFSLCPDIQEYGCGALFNATLTDDSPYYSTFRLQDGIKLAFDALMNHNLDINVVQNATLFLRNMSQNSILELYTAEADKRVRILCTVTCENPRNRSVQESCLTIIIKTCEEHALLPYVEKFFAKKPDLPEVASDIASVCIEERDPNLFSLFVVLLLFLSEDKEVWDGLTHNGKFVGTLINSLEMPWMKSVLAVKVLTLLLKVCCEWESCNDRRPPDLNKASNAIFSILSRYPLDERIQEYGCAVLEGIFNCRVHIVSSPPQAEIAVKLIHANKENPTIVKSYFNMLWSAAHGSDDRKLALDGAGAIKAATTVMKLHTEDLEMQIQGCGLIATLLSHKDVGGRAVRLKWTCGLSQVIYAMKKFPKDPYMQTTGMEVLCNTIACNADIYFTYESMKIAVLNLAKFCDDLRVVSTALALLRNLVYQDPLDQKFLKFGGLVAIIGVIRMNHMSSVCPLALSVLGVILESKRCANAFEATWPGLLPALLKRASSGFYRDDTVMISVMRCILNVIQTIGVITRSTIEMLLSIFRDSMDKFQIVYMCCLIFEALSHYDAFVNSPSKDVANELMAVAITKWPQSESLHDVVNKFTLKLSKKRILIGDNVVRKKDNEGTSHTSFKTIGDAPEFALDRPVDN